MSDQKQLSRKLSAILFADIVGYTAMMQSDEGKAMSRLRHYQEVLKKSIANHEGQIIKNYGDGSLCIFSSVLAAVRCANDVQTTLQQKPIVPLRIGIHLGDVMFKDGDVYGNDINIASRIESMGISGSILFSKNIYQKIKNQSGFTFQSLGLIGFKNVEDPIEVFALANKGLAVPNKRDLKGKFKSSHSNRNKAKAIAFTVLLFLAAIWIYNQQGYNVDKSKYSRDKPIDLHSIAVLPLVNLNSKNDNLEYFSRGVTQEIIDELANIASIKVSAFTESSYYSGQSLSPVEIAQKLGVKYLISGSSRLFDDAKRVKLSIELFNPTTKERLWSNTFDEEMDDAVSIQSSIAQNIAESLNIELSPNEIRSIQTLNTNNGEAFKFVLLAKAEIDKFTTQGFELAREFLQKAIELDPNYTQAYTLMAWCNSVGSSADITPGVGAVSDAISSVKPYIAKAIELNPNSSDNYIIRANMNIYLANKIRDAKRDIDYAIELNSWPQVPINYCMCTAVSVYAALGDLSMARSVLELAKKVDPGNLLLSWDEGNLDMLNGKYDEAIAHFAEISQRADLPTFNNYHGWSLLSNGQYLEAKDVLQKEYDRNELNSGMNVGYLSSAYYKLKDLEKSDFYLNELLLRKESGEYHLDLYLASVYLHRGDSSKALDSLEEALRIGGWGVAVITSLDPVFRQLDDHPRFIELRRKMQYYETEPI